MIDKFIKLITSLKLTVVCLLCSLVVVFFGTMAQDPLGLYISQERFFHSFFIDWAAMWASVKKTLQMFGVYMTPSTGAQVLQAQWVPVFPGGYLLGSVLLINLIATHFTKFKWTKAKSGIFLTHAGIILLLVGQLFTDMFAKESNLRLEEGQTKNYSIDARKNELAVVKIGENSNRVISIPESKLKVGKVISHPEMPFQLKVTEYWKSSDISGSDAPGYMKVDATQGIGPRVYVKSIPAATAMDARDIPAVVVEVLDSGHGHGTWFSTPSLARRQFHHDHDGNQWEIAFRFKRYYTPYSITLLEAKHDKYKGTEIPRNFSSVVRIEDSVSGENRETKIFMNNPLRYAGKTYYQYQMAAGEMMASRGLKSTSTLQVVQNPSWLAPYLGCGIVGLGLVIQFLIHLVKFAKKRKPA
ncbi:MAG: ResB protein required for cytochrome C biosynthesis [Verrucomicrobiales bacterium]|nr:ResB protein required for cytochrome C biosynthesis [Verrucomicrobiales bacterium]|tara:strand:- start:5437 stop:6675 length:1239 start_codon:yes stop_codon:yes gene_type:complete